MIAMDIFCEWLQNSPENFKKKKMDYNFLAKTENKICWGGGVNVGHITKKKKKSENFELLLTRRHNIFGRRLQFLSYNNRFTFPLQIDGIQHQDIRHPHFQAVNIENGVLFLQFIQRFRGPIFGPRGLVVQLVDDFVIFIFSAAIGRPNFQNEILF